MGKDPRVESPTYGRVKHLGKRTGLEWGDVTVGREYVGLGVG
jgi:hypothetical protein